MHHFHRLWVEDKKAVANSRENFALGGEGRRVTSCAGHERRLEHFLLFSRIKGEKLRLALDRLSAAASVVAAAPENQAALRLPGQRDDALVGDQVAVVLDG